MRLSALRRCLGSVLLAGAPVMLSAVAARAEDAPRTQPALSRHARVVLAVDRADEASQRIAGIVNKLGGRVVRAQDRELRVDVPNGSYRDFVTRLTELGDLRSEQLSTQDVTTQIAEAAADERSAEQKGQRLQRLDSIARDVPEHIIVERERQATTQEIQAAKKRQRDIEDGAAVTHVSITLVGVPIEHIEKTRLPFPWLAELSLPNLLNTSDSGRQPSLDLRAIVDGEFGLRGAHAASEDRYGTSNTLAFTTNMRVLGEAEPVGLFGGFDLALGGGGGFLYGLQTILGVGVPIGSRFAFGLGTGPGFDGITATVPIGVTLPVELYVTWDFSRYMAANAWVRDGWVFAAEDRKKGSQHAPFGDELSAGISLALGARDGGHYSQNRFGPRVGFGYREMLDTRVYEITLAFGAHTADFSETY